MVMGINKEPEAVTVPLLPMGVLIALPVTHLKLMLQHLMEL